MAKDPRFPGMKPTPKRRTDGKRALNLLISDELYDRLERVAIADRRKPGPMAAILIEEGVENYLKGGQGK